MNGIFKVGLLTAGLAVVASGAEAQTLGQWYVEGAGSIARLEKAQQTIANAPFPGATLVATNEVETGWGGRLAVGRAVSNFRLEVEIGRTDHDSGSYVITAPIQATLQQDGQAQVERAMANVYYDLLEEDAPLRPYLGAGIGHAQVSFYRFAGTAVAPNNRFKHLDDEDDGFAWQAIAGASLRVAPNLRLTAQYRYLDAGDYELRDMRGQAVRGELASHNLDFGARVSF